MSAARFWYKRFEETGSLSSLPRPGRPKLLSPDDEEDIIERIKENPFLTAISFAREYGVRKGVVRYRDIIIFTN